jgi:hypothetical protein
MKKRTKGSQCAVGTLVAASGHLFAIDSLGRRVWISEPPADQLAELLNPTTGAR